MPPRQPQRQLILSKMGIRRAGYALLLTSFALFAATTYSILLSKLLPPSIPVLTRLRLNAAYNSSITLVASGHFRGSALLLNVRPHDAWNHILRLSKLAGS